MSDSTIPVYEVSLGEYKRAAFRLDNLLRAIEEVAASVKDRNWRTLAVPGYFMPQGAHPVNLPSWPTKEECGEALVRRHEAWRKMLEAWSAVPDGLKPGLEQPPPE